MVDYVHLEDRQQGALLKPERQNRILQMVQGNTQVTVTQLSHYFGVSEGTIRRDLEELAENGYLRRTHGGALRVEQTADEPPIHQRTSTEAEEKRRIGEAAAKLVADDETVFIGSGTTALEVARALVGRRRITVVTNALTVINAVASDPNIKLIILGGILRRSELSMTGPITEHAIREMRADKCIIGVTALHPEHGLTNAYMPETVVEREVLSAGMYTIVVADHTKFNKTAPVHLCPLTAVHTIITGSAAPSDCVELIRGQGVEVIMV